MREKLGQYVTIKTGKLDANASSNNGQYPFFTCAVEPLKINTYSYDCECVLLAGNGDLNVKYYFGKFDAYQRTYIIESKNKSKLSVRYLYYYLDEYVKTLRKLSIGGVIKYIKLGNLTDAPIFIPSLSDQNKIISVLDKVSELIALRKRQLDLLDEMVKARFVEMFGDPFSNPMKWERKRFKDVCTRLSDGPFGSNLKSEHYSENGIRVIRLGNIGTGVFIDEDKAFIPLEHYEKLKKYTCKTGEIIIGTLGEPNLRACLIPSEIGIAINKADCVHYIPIKELLNTRFVCQYINSPETLLLAQTMIHGQTRTRISSGQIGEMPIFIPPMELQTQFADFVQQVEKSKATVQQGLDRLNLLKSALMQEYFG